MEGDFKQQSEFNMAIAWLNTVHGLFCSCIEQSVALNAWGWYQSLLALSRELSTEFSKVEEAEDLKYRERIAPMLQQNINRQQRTGRMIIAQELYQQLDSYNRFLKRVLKTSGLLNRMMDDATRALK